MVGFPHLRGGRSGKRMMKWEMSKKRRNRKEIMKMKTMEVMGRRGVNLLES